MKTEKMEDIKMYTGIILLGEIFMVMLGVGPAIILWIQRKPLGEYSSGLVLSEYVTVILVFTLMAYLLMIRVLRVKSRKLPGRGEDRLLGMYQMLYQPIRLKCCKTSVPGIPYQFKPGIREMLLHVPDIQLAVLFLGISTPVFDSTMFVNWHI